MTEKRIPATPHQPDRERIEPLWNAERFAFEEIVHAETDPRYRAMLRWATSKDADSDRGKRLLDATFAKLWRSGVSHS